MEKVASHINEMQKIYEDFGCVFDQLSAEHSSPDRQVRTHLIAHIMEQHLPVHSSLNPSPLTHTHTGDGDLHGRVPGPLVGGVAEPTARSPSVEEGARAHSVW